MKKQKLFSLGALCAAMIAPCALTSVAPVTAEPAIIEQPLSADAFIDQFCGTRTITLEEAGSQQAPFVWFETITDENRALIVQGRVLFNTLDAAVQQTIIQACQAHQIDYIAFSDQALAEQKVIDQAAAALKPKQPADSQKTAEPEKPAHEHPVDSSANASREDLDSQAKPESQTEDRSSDASSDSKNDREQPGDSSPDKEQERDNNTDQNKDKETEQKPAANLNEEQPAQTDTSAQHENGSSVEGETDRLDNSADLSSNEQTSRPDSAAAPDSPHPEPDDAARQPAKNLQALPFAVPYNPGTVPAGLTCAPAGIEADESIRQCAERIASSAGMSQWHLQSVVYTYFFEGAPIVSQPYWFVQNGQQTVIFRVVAADEQSVTIQFADDSSCSFDGTTGTLSLKAGSEVVFTDQNATPYSDEIDGETAPLEADQSSQKKEESVPTVAQSGASIDTAATDFINRYCYQQGGLIRQASVASCQQILNGLSGWLQLSAASKSSVNVYLQNMGGTTFQTLYRQANQIRLGLPVSSTLIPGRAPQRQPGGSVATGAGEDFALWMSSAAASFETLFYFWMKPRRKEED